MKTVRKTQSEEAEIKTRSIRPLTAPHWNSDQAPRPANDNLAGDKICPLPCHSGKTLAKEYHPAASKMWWLP